MSLIHKQISNAFVAGRPFAKGAHTVNVEGNVIKYIHYGTTCIVRDLDNPNGDLILDDGGYKSPTTKTMMNVCLSALGFPTIEQREFKWYIGSKEFTQGMVIPGYWAEK